MILCLPIGKDPLSHQSFVYLAFGILLFRFSLTFLQVHQPGKFYDFEHLNVGQKSEADQVTKVACLSTGDVLQPRRGLCVPRSTAASGHVEKRFRRERAEMIGTIYCDVIL